MERQDTVSCGGCGRNTPRARRACLYCGTLLPGCDIGPERAAEVPVIPAENQKDMRPADGNRIPHPVTGLPVSVEELFAQLRMERKKRLGRISVWMKVLIFLVAAGLGGVLMWIMR